MLPIASLKPTISSLNICLCCCGKSSCKFQGTQFKETGEAETRTVQFMVAGTCDTTCTGRSSSRVWQEGQSTQMGLLLPDRSPKQCYQLEIKR